MKHMKPDGGITGGNLCDRAAGHYCTGTYVYHGLCDEPDIEIQSFGADRIRIVL